jgi:hypothetical protein
MRRIYPFQTHQNFRNSYYGVELCNAITQAPIRGISSARCMIDNIKQNHMNDEQMIHYLEDDQIKSTKMGV